MSCAPALYPRTDFDPGDRLNAAGGRDNATVSTSRLTAQTPALILGSHIAALGVLRVLARRGVPCHVVDETTNIIARSRWHRPTQPTLVESSDPEALSVFLRSLDLQRAVLLPCSDEWALAVAGLPSDLRERFSASVPPADAVAQFVDKDRFRRLIERLDLPRPRTLVIRGPADLDVASDDDVVTGSSSRPTPTCTTCASERRGSSFTRARRRFVWSSRRALPGSPICCRSGSPGDPSKTILIDGFVDRTGTLAATVARRRVRMYPPRLAPTCCDVTIPLSEVSQVMDPLRALLAAVGYRGIFNVEFKFDERDERFKIIEVNPRPFWLIGHIARTGVDLPWMSYLDAQGLPLPVPVPYQIGRYGLYEVPDIAAITQAWFARHRPDGPVLRSWLTGDRTLFWWSDPLPAVRQVQLTLGRHLGRSRGAAPRPTRGSPAPAEIAGVPTGDLGTVRDAPHGRRGVRTCSSRSSCGRPVRPGSRSIRRPRHGASHLGCRCVSTPAQRSGVV